MPALLAALCGTANGEAIPLKVMSFNVRYGTAKDGDNSWPNRKDILVNTIRNYAPDVVGTQECLDIQADYIVEKLPEYRWAGVAREADGSNEHMAVFYRKSVLSPIEIGNFWLSETPEVVGSRSWLAGSTRMVTWIRFYHLKTRKQFFYFNTHLDNASPIARDEGAKLLAARMPKIAGEGPMILTGDFNTLGGSSNPWKILIEAGLKDAWLEAEKRVGGTVTFGGYKPPPAEGDSRIDWIMFRGDVKAKTCETVYYNEDGRYPSDHYPIYAELMVNCK
ncbi:MAG TPA: endonuclease/exonuclease/phosphatase family protein [Candidatus Brocadiia bacterium]|nr:endonuclease/exonuclease/phosphatase family protein [Candidatus Brocadiia bacterium]